MRNLLLIAMLLSIMACTQKPSYKLSINLSKAEGEVYLNKRAKGEWIKLDSAKLVNGECQLSGVVKYPEVYYLSIGTAKEKLPFFIENSVMVITGSVDSLMKAKITGSNVQDEYRKLKDQLDQLDKNGMAIYKQAKEAEKAGEKAKADSLMALADDTFNEIDNQQKAYIKANPSSFISPYLLGNVYYSMEADELDSYLSGFEAVLDSVAIVVTLKDRVVKLKNVAVGQIAPEFTMNDVDGNPVKLSDVYSKNEYTLVDFWASWCGPCRRENPNVVAVFNEYKTKGFGVFGVSLDTDKTKWMKAIADDQLTWTHVSDLIGWKNEAAALYSVNSIPANLLIDKSGKIIGRNLREEKLRETIAGLFK